MDNHTRYQTIKKVSLVGAFVNFTLSLVKILVGSIGRSPALVADGFHSLSDLLCDGMVLIAAYYARVEPDENHPYGHHRFETLATFMLGVVLLVFGLGIAYEAISSIIHHTSKVPDQVTAWVALFSILANEGLYHYTLHAGNKVHSDLLKANAWHNRADAVSSVIVLVGIIGALAGWTFLDAVAATIVAVIICKMGIKWGWRALAELMDEGLESSELDLISKFIQSVPGVLHMHQLRTRRMGGRVVLDVHILIDSYKTASEGHFVAEMVRVGLMKRYSKIQDVTIHVDIENHPEILPEKMLPHREALLSELMPTWQKLVGEPNISHIDLYYLDNKIEIVVHVLMSAIKERSIKSEDLLDEFKTSVANKDYISKINLLFSLDALS